MRYITPDGIPFFYLENAIAYTRVVFLDLFKSKDELLNFFLVQIVLARLEGSRIDDSQEAEWNSTTSIDIKLPKK